MLKRDEWLFRATFRKDITRSVNIAEIYCMEDQPAEMFLYKEKSKIKESKNIA